MNNQEFLEIKRKYETLLTLYRNCRKCIDCESCDKAEELADELIETLGNSNVTSLRENEREEFKKILFSVSSIFDELRKK